jgi:hypothetical protein
LRRFGSFSGDSVQSAGLSSGDAPSFGRCRALALVRVDSESRRQAGLPKLERGTCHPYRQKWKFERSSQPVMAVAVVGGRTDIPTMLRRYDHLEYAEAPAVASELRSGETSTSMYVPRRRCKKLTSH